MYPLVLLLPIQCGSFSSSSALNLAMKAGEGGGQEWARVTKTLFTNWCFFIKKYFAIHFFPPSFLIFCRCAKSPPPPQRHTKKSLSSSPSFFPSPLHWSNEVVNNIKISVSLTHTHARRHAEARMTRRGGGRRYFLPVLSSLSGCCCRSCCAAEVLNLWWARDPKVGLEWVTTEKKRINSASPQIGSILFLIMRKSSTRTRKLPEHP